MLRPCRIAGATGGFLGWGNRGTCTVTLPREQTWHVAVVGGVGGIGGVGSVGVVVVLLLLLVLLLVVSSSLLSFCHMVVVVVVAVVGVDVDVVGVGVVVDSCQ